MNIKTTLLLSSACILIACPGRARAAVVVYEGFSYGGTAGAMSGKTATGTGLTGSYNTTVAGTGGSANYVTSSLSFSSNFYPTTGGALTLSLAVNDPGTIEGAVAGVALNVGTLTGTVYSSYLFNLSSNSIDVSTDSIGTRLSNAQNTGSSPRMAMYGDSGNSSNNMAVSYASATSSQTGTAGTLALSLNTTYLMIGQWTNVGGAGGGTATMWIFTSADYDEWLTLGGGLEANLGTYATGRTQRAETTQIDFNNSTFLQFTVGEGSASSTGTMTGTFDELRFGSTLGSVAVPEPHVASLLAGAAFLVCARRIRRHRVA